MSVIIRLQNLPWNAHALHIRQYFKGLSIPDGGVHIVGGDLGDAFIAFSTDEDARRAMMLAGKELNNVPIKLFLSSKTEMQKVIAQARGTPADKDERSSMGLPQMNEPPPLHAPDLFSHPPPPILQGNFTQGRIAPAAPNMIGGSFNPTSYLPERGAATVPRGPGGDAPRRYPNAPNRFGIASRLPPRPDIVRNDRPDILKQDMAPNNPRQDRENILRYDSMRQKPTRKGTPDILKSKPDIIRDERVDSGIRRREDRSESRHSTEDRRGRRDDRSSGDRGRNSGRGSSRGRDARRSDRYREDEYRSRSRHEDNRRSRHEDDRRSRHEDDRRSRHEDDRRSRHEDDRRSRYSDSDRNREKYHERDDRRERYEDSEPRDREQRSDMSRYDDKERHRYGSRDASKGQRPPSEDLNWDSSHSRSKQLTESRSRYGTRTSADRSRDLNDQGNCAFISQLPLSVSYKDIRRFFNKEQLRIPESGLKLENNVMGNRNGNAYVQFVSMECREKAMGLDGTFLDSHRIRIERCSVVDFEHAIDSFVPEGNRRAGIEKAEKEYHDKTDNPPDVVPHSPDDVRKEFFETCCVMLRNLPARVERFQVRLFFKSLGITQNGVYIPFDGKGSCLGVAYVEFETVSEAEEAMRRYDGTEFMDSTHKVDMYPITMEEAKERIEQHKRNFMKGGKQQGGYEHGRTDDHREPRHSDYRAEGRYSNYRSEGDRSRDENNGNRWEDYRSRNEHQSRERSNTWDQPQDRGRRSGDPPRIEAKTNQIPMAANHTFQCIRLSGLPFHADVGLVEGFFFDLSIRPNGIHVVFSPDAQCIGTAYVEFTNIDDCTKAVERDNTPLGKRVIRVAPVSEQVMVAELNRHKVNDQYIVSRATQEAPGQPCDVIMSNIPFKATMFDVNQFLHGTSFIPESILFEVDQQGNSMGNVKVTFFNSQAAHRALLTLIKKQLNGRAIRFKVL